MRFLEPLQGRRSQPLMWVGATFYITFSCNVTKESVEWATFWTTLGKFWAPSGKFPQDSGSESLPPITIQHVEYVCSFGASILQWELNSLTVMILVQQFNIFAVLVQQFSGHASTTPSNVPNKSDNFANCGSTVQTFDSFAMGTTNSLIAFRICPHRMPKIFINFSGILNNN